MEQSSPRGGSRVFQRRVTQIVADDNCAASALFVAADRLDRFLLLVVALARPQQGKEEHRVRADGIAIEMCIDRSGSMNAKDFEINGEPASRLEVVRKMFRQFVNGGDGLRGRPDDMIGLIDFGGYVNVKCPLTLDHGALEQLLATVKVAEPVVDAAGRVVNPKLFREDESTAIGDALATAVDRLKAIKAKSKIIILLSDGVSNAGILTPEEAAQIAKTFGIKVYTIGIGSTKQVGVPVENSFGQTVMMPMQVDFDERALKHIADVTDGQYFNAEDTKSLRDVYAAINKLETTVSEGRIYADYRDLYEYALLSGLALLVLQVVLASTRFRTLP